MRQTLFVEGSPSCSKPFPCAIYHIPYTMYHTPYTIYHTPPARNPSHTAGELAPTFPRDSPDVGLFRHSSEPFVAAIQQFGAWVCLSYLQRRKEEPSVLYTMYTEVCLSYLQEKEGGSLLCVIHGADVDKVAFDGPPHLCTSLPSVRLSPPKQAVWCTRASLAFQPGQCHTAVSVYQCIIFPFALCIVVCQFVIHHFHFNLHLHLYLHFNRIR